MRLRSDQEAAPLSKIRWGSPHVRIEMATFKATEGEPRRIGAFGGRLSKLIQTERAIMPDL